MESNHYNNLLTPENQVTYAQFHGEGGLWRTVIDPAASPEMLAAIWREHKLKGNQVFYSDRSANFWLSCDYSALKAKVAAHPNASAELLSEIADHCVFWGDAPGGNMALCNAVAGNPNTPLSALLAVYASVHNRDWSYAIHGIIKARLAATPPEGKREFLCGTREVLFMLAGDPGSPSDLLADLVGQYGDVSYPDRSEGVLWNALRNPNCPQELLSLWFEQGGAREHMAIAANPNCPSQLLEAMADSSEERVRCYVMGNANTPQRILRKEAAKMNNGTSWFASNNPAMKGGAV